MADIYKITNPSDRARAQRPERPRHARHRAATEQAERYVIRPFQYAGLYEGSHWISEKAPDAVAELVPHIIARAG